jgi:hypothetical protein
MTNRVPAPKLQPLAESMLRRYLSEGESTPAVLFVLGAAASFRSGMPSWKYVKGPLVKAAQGSFHSSKLFVDEAWRQLAPYIGPAPRRNREATLLDVAKTEQILGVACATEVVGKRVVRVLTNTYRKNSKDRSGEAPQLGYELIAHFLRHGFVDHVVNFNFDEALDVALDNELGRHGYRRVLSDSDVVLEDHRVAVERPGEPPPRRPPHHLKLHGTISVPSSLRFTKDHTQSIPVGMLNVLDQIAFAGGRRRLHLVTLGYSWNDPDFVNWVVARAELIDRVTIVRGHETAIPALLEARYSERYGDSRRSMADAPPPRQLTSFVDIVATSQIPIDGRIETAIDDILWALANGIEERLLADKVDYVPIARHVVLGHLFGPERQHFEDRRPVKWGFDPVNKHTASLRLRLELWLHLFKCKGMLTLSGVAETPRIQAYMEALAGPYELDSYLPTAQRNAPREQVRETFFHAGRNAGEVFADLVSHALLSFKQEEVAVPTFELAGGEIRVDNKDGKDFVRDLFAGIWECDETEVTTVPDPRVKWLFANPLPLTSYLQLRRKTNQLLESPWTHLLIIAESGEWLAKWLRHHASQLTPGAAKQILLIRVGDAGLIGDELHPGWGAWESIKARNESQFAKGPQLREIALPWWRHNRHLTLALSADGKRAVKFLQGIYFRRRLKASRIAPVWLDEADCGELFLIFLAYAIRALPLSASADAMDFATVLAGLTSRARVRAADHERLEHLFSRLAAAARGAEGSDRLI